jgi:hypothetical protein
MNCKINNNVITACLTDGSYRKFKTTLKKSYRIQRFGKIYTLETLYPMILSGDYTYDIYSTYMELTFTFIYEAQVKPETIILDETFDEVDMALVPEDIKPQIMSLQHHIRYLKDELEEANARIRNLESYMASTW